MMVCSRISPSTIEVKMKRLVIISVVIVLVLAIAGPALAASLGVSPSRIELEVPGDGSITADFQVHYFKGDVQVSLVDIPLRIVPDVLHVDALAEPEDVQVTIYGDESLGSQFYEGYVRFRGLSGGMIAIEINVKANVIHIMEGQPVPVTPEPESGTLAENTEESQELIATSSAPPPAEESDSSSFLGGIEGLSTNVVIIIAAAVVFIGLIILAISMASRRKKRYY